MNEKDTRQINRLISLFYSTDPKDQSERRAALPKTLAVAGCLFHGAEQIEQGILDLQMRVHHLQTIQLAWSIVSESGSQATASVYCESLFHNRMTNLNRIMEQQATFVLEREGEEWSLLYVQDALIDPLSFEDLSKTKNALLEQMNAYMNDFCPEAKSSKPLNFWDPASVWNKAVPVCSSSDLPDEYFGLEQDYLRILRNEGSYRLMPELVNGQPVMAYTGAAADNYFSQGVMTFVNPDVPKDEWGIRQGGLNFEKEMNEAKVLLEKGEPVVFSPGKLGTLKLIAVPAKPVYGLFLEEQQEQFLSTLKKAMELASQNQVKSIVINENWRNALNAPAEFGSQKMVPLIAESAYQFGMESVLMEALRADTKKAFKGLLLEHK